MPFIIKNHAGEGMCQRLGELIRMFKKEGAQFITFTEFTNNWKK